MRFKPGQIVTINGQLHVLRSRCWVGTKRAWKATTTSQREDLHVYLEKDVTPAHFAELTQAKTIESEAFCDNDFKGTSGVKEITGTFSGKLKR